MPPIVTTPGAGPQIVVDLSFSVSGSDRLYMAWQAIANLAEMAGNLDITVHAESEAGFDKSKLQNGVLEPLREADLIK
jgi:hypothetical protein